MEKTPPRKGENQWLSIFLAKVAGGRELVSIWSPENFCIYHLYLFVLNNFNIMCHLQSLIYNTQIQNVECLKCPIFQKKGK